MIFINWVHQMLLLSLSILGTSMSIEYIKGDLYQAVTNPSLYVFGGGIFLIIYIFVCLQDHIYKLYIERDVNYFLYTNCINERPLMEKEDVKDLYLRFYRKFIDRIERPFITHRMFKILEFCAAEMTINALFDDNYQKVNQIIDRYIKVYEEQEWILHSLYQRILFNITSLDIIANEPLIKLNKLLIENYNFYPNFNNGTLVRKKYWDTELEYNDIMLKMFTIIIIFEKNKNLNL